MTECERIIKDGILPKSFFLPETICDFHVDEKRKKMWAIGIDMLVKFDEVCRKHELRYSLAFGSLLGVVRHKGFIPWDDDIDVVMPREDYEKLKGGSVVKLEKSLKMIAGLKGNGLKVMPGHGEEFTLDGYDINRSKMKLEKYNEN